MRRKRTAMKFISRIDSARTHAYFVRTYKNGVVDAKLFSDKKMGGKGKALAAAKAYREKIRKKLKLPPL